MNARILKFRAWHYDCKKMINHLHAIEFGTGDTYIHYFVDGLKRYLPISHDYIMQFTGLKDANDVEIYEGDIIEFGDKYVERIVVKWGTSCGCCNSVYGFVIDHGHYNHSDGRVIGNVYENKDLLP